MKVDEFNKISEYIFGNCLNVLTQKNKEYASDEDKLANFKEAAALKDETPEKALWGMWVKHIISIKKIIRDIDMGILPTEKIFLEKVTDNINYSVLLAGLLEERLANDSKTQEPSSASK
jgi:hypothetical protein